jgi:hypothetical protein
VVTAKGCFNGLLRNFESSSMEASAMASPFTKENDSLAAGTELEVVLGSRTIKAFLAAPKDMPVLGIVRCGMEYGWLATTPAGDYLRVNGTQTRELNSREVEAAIARVCSNGRGESYASSRRACGDAKTRCAPAVMVRRQRRIDPLLVARTDWH